MTISEITATGAALGVGVVALTFTPADINTAIIGVTALVTALGIAVVNIMAQRAVAKKVDAARDVLGQTLAKVEVVEGHVNSATAKAEAIIKAQEEQLRMQRETIVKLEQTAALLAQAQIQKKQPS